MLLAKVVGTVVATRKERPQEGPPSRPSSIHSSERRKKKKGPSEDADVRPKAG
jgi:hypothetical protein